MSLQTRITALVQTIGADIKALYSGKVGTSDARLTDAREWTASTVTQPEAEAGIATTRRAWTAQRVFQAIAAWWAASEMKTKLDGIAAGATANATDAQLRDRSTHTGTQAISTVTGLQTALDGKINTSERGVSGGIPTLDEFARIPPSQLPSYVDDVLEFATTAQFPTTGEGGKIYIAINQGTAANPTRQYRWTGSVYAEINPSPGTTDALAEGSTNLYFNESRVRNTVLTGLSLANSAAVAATDSVLAAFGKIQAQLGLKAPLASPALTGNPTAPTPAAEGADTSIATTAFVRAAMALFGVGSTALSDIASADDLSAGGIYRFGINTTGRPSFINYGTILAVVRSSNEQTQLAQSTNSNGIAIRYKVGGNWSTWQELWHTGNLVKQTSPTDTTAGALMTVGAFGLGGTGLPVADYNTTPNGNAFLFGGGGTTSNRPGGGSSYAINLFATDLYAHQLGAGISEDALRFRNKNNGVWGAWRTLFHTGNFDPATKQDKSSLVTTATTRTLALTDAWNYVRPGTTSAITLTVPTNAAVAFEVGTEITIRASGNITLAAATGVTLNAPSGGTLSMTARMTVTLKKVGADVWDVIGQTVAA
ncbi:pyocin knob domain-containing protein [Stutzerimonas frequens]|uniref:pyocin knob domain-containing protein n=1 Tax=Stutzerimonas frequens TaxID=2968969 RepID=UPI00190ACAAD|nr:pyocin knob domain-containing protein [Stutzerimonas frequens]MBK3870975.1 hypothetical protein [Stutzerimonas frequens]MBK3909312.1 hypothetical protein [Stutzerimonas frequens]